jgi:hypothetical protein
MLADGLTKPLPRDGFSKMVEGLGLLLYCVRIHYILIPRPYTHLLSRYTRDASLVTLPIRDISDSALPYVAHSFRLSLSPLDHTD